MTAVIILGFHRSGTSALAGALHKAGIYMGSDLIGVNRFNLKGHFEDRDFVDLNGRILTAIGYGWQDLPQVFPTQFVRNRFSGEIKKLLAKKNQRSLWGWKDPRTCITLPAYLSYLKKYKLIWIKRDRKQSVESLYKKEHDIKHGTHWEKHRFYGLHDDYMRLLHQVLKDKEHFKLTYAALLDNPTSQLRDISDYVGHELDLSVGVPHIQKELNHASIH